MNSATKVQKKENKTAIYCRISTSMQSTDRQKEDLLKVAERFELEIDADHIYIDIITGFSIGEERPNYSALLDEVEKGNIDTILFSELTRLGRSSTELLAEIQRIKSEGDFKAAQNIVENYGVKIDPTLHEEVLERYSKLNLSPYKGFVNPVYKASYNADGSFKNVTIDYTEGYAEQMLRYSHDYSHL